MSDYVPIYLRPDYTEAFELGRKHGSNPKSGYGMATFFYGRPKDDDPDKEKTEHMNSAYLAGWFTGSSEWSVKHPDPRIVKIDEPRPMTKSKGQASD